MERQKVQQPRFPAYPARTALTPALTRRVALAAALAAAPLVACNTTGNVDGLMAEPDEPWAVDLPIEGSREVVLSDGMELDYHLALLVDGGLVDCLTGQEEAVLVEVDGVLAVEPAASFEAGAELDEIEAAVAGTMAAFCGAAVEDIEETSLVVDQLGYPEEI
jgi:hypothetical protein